MLEKTSYNGAETLQYTIRSSLDKAFIISSLETSNGFNSVRYSVFDSGVLEQSVAGCHLYFVNDISCFEFTL